MDCKRAQQQLSFGTDPDPALRSHLESCLDCRQFAADLLYIREMIDPGVSTPVLLREQTLDLCRTKLAELSNGKPVSVAQHLRILFESPRFVAITAMLSVLLLATSVVLQFVDHQDSGTNMIVKISVIQIVLQNIMAALFMPALLIFRNRMGGRFLSPAQTGD